MRLRLESTLLLPNILSDRIPQQLNRFQQKTFVFRFRLARLWRALISSIYIYIYILEWTRNKIVAEFCWTCGLMDLSCMFRHQVRATIFVELVD